MKGKIVAVSISEKRGTKKENVESALLIKDRGVKGDAHAGSEKRQISLLAFESINKMQSKSMKLNPGDFAENITTLGINLTELPLGSKLKMGKEAIIEITQKGKLCHNQCSIYYSAGYCIMPKEGVFAKIVQGGFIKPNDIIKVEN
ncbi:MOSC domain-containing protein [candidate division KSB1 bacterium]